MGFATSVRSQQMVGHEKQAKTENPDELDSPAGTFHEADVILDNACALTLICHRHSY
jgi:hypothetical protein